MDGDPADYRLPEVKCWLECDGQSRNGSLQVATEKVWRCKTKKIQVYRGVVGRNNSYGERSWSKNRTEGGNGGKKKACEPLLKLLIKYICNSFSVILKNEL